MASASSGSNSWRESESGDLRNSERGQLSARASTNTAPSSLELTVKPLILPAKGWKLVKVSDREVLSLREVCSRETKLSLCRKEKQRCKPEELIDR